LPLGDYLTYGRVIFLTCNRAVSEGFAGKFFFATKVASRTKFTFTGALCGV